MLHGQGSVRRDIAMQTVYPGKKYCSNCNMNNHDIKECWKLNGKHDKGKQRFNNNRNICKPGSSSEQTNKKQAANSAQAETDKEKE